jgi:hypothetical protein
VGKLLKVSRVVERGSPKSNLWNPPLDSVLRISGGRMSISIVSTRLATASRSGIMLVALLQEMLVIMP